MKFRLIMLAAACIMSASAFAQQKTETIKVWGNCESCKSRIEKAAKDAGAATADWSDETLMLTVSYDESKTSSLNIEKQIASVGYDTRDVKGSDEAYKNLPGCCQYQRHEYSQSSKTCCTEGASCCTSGAACCASKADGASKASCCVEGAACCTSGAACCASKADGASKASCCVEGAACCTSGAACCASKADGASKASCCVEGAACCTPGAACCASSKADNASVTGKKDCCTTGSACCVAGSSCCAGHNSK